jgi:hypothetical protein
MAISLAYGVAIGTIFILLFFPLAIMLLSDIRVFTRKFWTGEMLTREEVEVAVIHHRRRLIIEANGKEQDDAEYKI